MRCLGFLLLLVVVCVAQPQLTLDSAVYMHEPVEEGSQDTVVYTIPLLNRGNQPLRIEGVRLSCSCTRAVYDSVVQPAATGALRVVVDIKGKDSGIASHVVITSNSSAARDTHLDLLCPIKPHSAVVRLLSADSMRCTVAVASRSGDLRILGARIEPMFKGDTTCGDVGVSVVGMRRVSRFEEENRWVYNLALASTVDLRKAHCKLVLATNLEEKREIRCELPIR